MVYPKSTAQQKGLKQRLGNRKQLLQTGIAGLSLRAGGRGFSPATKRVAPGYFYWKIEGK